MYYQACTEYLPELLHTKNLAHRALPSTTLHYKAFARHFPVYKACTKYLPVLLRFSNLAQSTCQEYFVLQSFPHTSHFTSRSTLLHTLTLHSPHFTLHATHRTPHTTHCTLHTLHSTLHTTHSTLHYTLHTPRSTLHTSHSITLHTSHPTLHTQHFTFHTSQVTMHFHASQTITFCDIPHRQWNNAIRKLHSNFRLSVTKPHANLRNTPSHVPTHHPCGTSCKHNEKDEKRRNLDEAPECHEVPRLPCEMHFHTSQTITFCDMSHRQWDDAIKDLRNLTKTIRKQSTTPRPPSKKTRTLRYAVGKTAKQDRCTPLFVCEKLTHLRKLDLCESNERLSLELTAGGFLVIACRERLREHLCHLQQICSLESDCGMRFSPWRIKVSFTIPFFLNL